MEELPFNPLPIIKGKHQQTVLGTFAFFNKGPPSETMDVVLPDKDIISLEVSTPQKWKKDDLTVVMIHGLCGSHLSPYLVRIAAKLYQKNVRAVRINLRGSGSGRGKARKIYHGGQSDDAYEVLKALKKEAPNSDLVLAGFSLGGNIALKTAAELSMKQSDIIKKVIAVNPAVDLYASAKLLKKKENRMYERYFLKHLKNDIKFRNKMFPDFPKVNFPPNFDFFDFDRLYTVFHYGFEDLWDFYKKSSSRYLIPAINVSCTILFSEDDPIIKCDCLDNIALPGNITIYKTKKGGHMGYLTLPCKENSIHWIDDTIIKWIFQ